LLPTRWLLRHHARAVLRMVGAPVSRLRLGRLRDGCGAKRHRHSRRRFLSANRDGLRSVELLCCCGDVLMGGCVYTPADQYCGHGGVSCSACGANERCLAFSSGGGSCDATPPCGPDSCAGCCFGNVCAVGDQNIACGSGGMACATCSDGGSCVANTCYAR
jgi:hypothetical protein